MFGNLGYLTAYYVKKFLSGAKSRGERRALKSVSLKLTSLGVDVRRAMNNQPKVAVNLSRHNLLAADTNLLNQGLNYSSFPEKLNISQVRIAEFEYTHEEIRHYLNNSNHIAFTQKLMSLYNRNVITFFQQKGQHPTLLSEEQQNLNALHSIRDNSSRSPTKETEW